MNWFKNLVEKVQTNEEEENNNSYLNEDDRVPPLLSLLKDFQTDHDEEKYQALASTFASVFDEENAGEIKEIIGVNRMKLFIHNFCTKLVNEVNERGNADSKDLACKQIFDYFVAPFVGLKVLRILYKLAKDPLFCEEISHYSIIGTICKCICLFGSTIFDSQQFVDEMVSAKVFTKLVDILLQSDGGKRDFVNNKCDMFLLKCFTMKSKTFQRLKTQQHRLWRDESLLIFACAYSKENITKQLVENTDICKSITKLLETVPYTNKDGILTIEAIDEEQLIYALRVSLIMIQGSYDILLGPYTEFTENKGFDTISHLCSRAELNGETQNLLCTLLSQVVQMVYKGKLLVPGEIDVSQLQDPLFEIPFPDDSYGTCVRNEFAFEVFEKVLVNGKTRKLRSKALDSIIEVLSADSANYFTLYHREPVLNCIAALSGVSAASQVKVFKLVEFIACSLNYVPMWELTSLKKLLLGKDVKSELILHLFSTVRQLLTFDVKYADILTLCGLFNALLDFACGFLHTRTDNEKGDRMKSLMTKEVISDTFTTLQYFIHSTSSTQAFFEQRAKKLCALVKMEATRKPTLSLFLKLINDKSRNSKSFNTLMFMLQREYLTVEEYRLSSDILSTLFAADLKEGKLKNLMLDQEGFFHLFILLEKIHSPNFQETQADLEARVELMNKVLRFISTTLTKFPFINKIFRLKGFYSYLRQALSALDVGNKANVIFDTLISMFLFNDLPQSIFRDDLDEQYDFLSVPIANGDTLSMTISISSGLSIDMKKRFLLFLNVLMKDENNVLIANECNCNPILFKTYTEDFYKVNFSPINDLLWELASKLMAYKTDEIVVRYIFGFYRQEKARENELESMPEVRTRTRRSAKVLINSSEFSEESAGSDLNLSRTSSLGDVLNSDLEDDSRPVNKFLRHLANSASVNYAEPNCIVFDLSKSGVSCALCPYDVVEEGRQHRRWPPTHGYSVMTWIKILDSTDDGFVRLFAFLDNTRSYCQYYIDTKTGMASVVIGNTTVHISKVKFKRNEWYHVAFVHSRGTILKNSVITLYVNGFPRATFEMKYLSSISTNEEKMLCLLGTASFHQNKIDLKFALGPTYVYDELLHESHIRAAFFVGPRYSGNFLGHLKVYQTYDILTNESLTTANSELSCFNLQSISTAFPSEENLILSLHAHNFFDISQTMEPLAENVQLSVDVVAEGLEDTQQGIVNGIGFLNDNGVISNAIQLFGSSNRIMYKTYAEALRSIGSCAGSVYLVDQATTSREIFLTLKLMRFSIYGHGHNASQMESEMGFQMVAMSLKRKAKLLTPEIVDQLFLLGGVDCKHILNGVIANSVVFKSLILDMDIWKIADPKLFCLILSRLSILMTDSSQAFFNLHRLKRLHLLQRLLFMLRDESLSDKIVLDITAVLSTILASTSCSPKDLERYTRFMITTVNPDASQGDTLIEYTEGESTQNKANHGLPTTEFVQSKRKIFLRDCMLRTLRDALYSGTNELTLLFLSVVGLQWILLFISANLKATTVMVATEILCFLITVYEGDAISAFQIDTQGFERVELEIASHSTIIPLYYYLLACVFGFPSSQLAPESVTQPDLEFFKKAFPKKVTKIHNPDVLKIIFGMLQYLHNHIATTQPDESQKKEAPKIDPTQDFKNENIRQRTGSTASQLAISEKRLRHYSNNLGGHAQLLNHVNINLGDHDSIYRVLVGVTSFLLHVLENNSYNLNQVSSTIIENLVHVLYTSSEDKIVINPKRASISNRLQGKTSEEKKEDEEKKKLRDLKAAAESAKVEYNFKKIVEGPCSHIIFKIISLKVIELLSSGYEMQQLLMLINVTFPSKESTIEFKTQIIKLTIGDMLSDSDRWKQQLKHIDSAEVCTNFASFVIDLYYLKQIKISHKIIINFLFYVLRTLIKQSNLEKQIKHLYTCINRMMLILCFRPNIEDKQEAVHLMIDHQLLLLTPQNTDKSFFGTLCSVLIQMTTGEEDGGKEIMPLWTLIFLQKNELILDLIGENSIEYYDEACNSLFQTDRPGFCTWLDKHGHDFEETVNDIRSNYQKDAQEEFHHRESQRRSIRSNSNKRLVQGKSKMATAIRRFNDQNSRTKIGFQRYESNNFLKFRQLYLDIQSYVFRRNSLLFTNLLRERGAFATESSSVVHWMLAEIEGPCRMRIRLCINPSFTKNFIYKPEKGAYGINLDKDKQENKEEEGYEFEGMSELGELRRRGTTNVTKSKANSKERMALAAANAASPPSSPRMGTSRLSSSEPPKPNLAELSPPPSSSPPKPDLEALLRIADSKKSAVPQLEDEKLSLTKTASTPVTRSSENIDSSPPKSPTASNPSSPTSMRRFRKSSGTRDNLTLTPTASEPLSSLSEGKTTSPKSPSKARGDRSPPVTGVKNMRRMSYGHHMAPSRESLRDSSSGPTPASGVSSRPIQTGRRRSVSIRVSSTVKTTSNGEEDNMQEENSIMRQLEPGDDMLYFFNTARISGLEVQPSLLLLCKRNIYFVDGYCVITHDNGYEIVEVKHAIKEGSFLDTINEDTFGDQLKDMDKFYDSVEISVTKCPYDALVEVYKRRYLLREIAIEIFSSDGRDHLLSFNKAEREVAYDLLVKKQQLKSSSEKDLMDRGISGAASSDVIKEGNILGGGLLSGLVSGLMSTQSMTQRWVAGEVSNFQYLMWVNTVAGRSFNDLTQYPVFPWILKDYDSETLDLKDPTIYRDLTKPMGTQTERRIGVVKERFENWVDPTGEVPPFHYGTHYSSAMIVASYLVRLEPFTQQFLTLQGGSFDHPDRMFQSVKESWLSASELNTADVKELIPEFYYLPEFLENNMKLDLGKKQSGEVLNDVALPRWAKGNVYEFIRIHRAALESDYVRANLASWIDLIFGYKQQGEEAIEAINCFHHLSYEGAVDLDKIADPVKRRATLSIINNFGQTPRRIFKKPHQKSNKIPFQPSLYHHPNSLELVSSVMKGKSQISQITEEKHTVSVAVGKQVFSPSNKHVLSWSGADRNLSCEYLNNVVHFENMHEGSITAVTYADRQTIVTAGKDGVVCVWKLFTDKRPFVRLLKSLFGHLESVSLLASSRPFSIIVSGSKDNTCIVWDLNTLEYIRQLKVEGEITALCIDNRLGDIVICTASEILLYSINGRLLVHKQTNHSSQSFITCCTVPKTNEWDPNYKVIVTGHDDGAVRIWKYSLIQSPTIHPDDEPPKWISFLHLVGEYILPTKHRCSISCVYFTNDGKNLMAGDIRGNLNTWHLPDEIDHSAGPTVATKCSKCQAKFSNQSNLRCYCESCGGVFCSNCTSGRQINPKNRAFVPGRVCDDCSSIYT